MQNINSDSYIFFNKLIEDSIKIFCSHENIIGLILIGSFANNSMDVYSDIDLVVIVKQDGKAEIKKWENHFKKQKEIIVSQIMQQGNWLSTLKKVNNLIVKVDYDFFNYKELKIILKDSFDRGTGICDGKILFERDNIISEVFKNNSHEKLNQNPEVNINELIVHFYSAIRMYKRGEFFEACDIINQIRDPYLLSLINKRNDLPFENYRKLEQRYSEDIIEKLSATYSSLNMNQIKLSLKNIGYLIINELNTSGYKLTEKQKTLLSDLISRI